MRMRKLFKILLFVNQFDVADVKTGEVYFSRCFNFYQLNIEERKLARMKIIKIVSEDKGRFTIWVEWYK